MQTERPGLYEHAARKRALHQHAARHKRAFGRSSARRAARRARAGMTLIEIIFVVVIMALAASGLGFSLGAIARTNLKASVGRFAIAARYAYNRAITHGTTVRIRFMIPSNTFSIEEAEAGVTLASAKAKERKQVDQGNGKMAVAVDPWAAAQARLATPLKPTVGASPFHALETEDGKPLKRYTDVKLGNGVQIVKLIVAHEPEPLAEGEGGVYFFPGGRTENAVVQMTDGRAGVYSVEIHPLTGRAKIHTEAFTPRTLLEDPGVPDERSTELDDR